MFLLVGCASVNPYDTSTDTAAHLLGKRAIVYEEMHTKENIYFVQINKKDLRDKWGDYPHDVYIPSGDSSLIVVCEWYTNHSNNAVATVAAQIRQRFLIGHEYQFSSQLVGNGMCETTFIDVTAQERRAEQKEVAASKQKAAIRKSKKKGRFK